MITKYIFVICGAIWILYGIFGRKRAEEAGDNVRFVEATIASGVGVLWFILAYLYEIRHLID